MFGFGYEKADLLKGRLTISGYAFSNIRIFCAIFFKKGSFLNGFNTGIITDIPRMISSFFIHLKPSAALPKSSKVSAPNTNLPTF